MPVTQRSAVVPAPLALSLETAAVEVAELLAVVARLDAHARLDGAAVTARSLVARALLAASLRHPAVDVRWPLLPARHGLRLSELTAALDGADAASPVPDDAAVLSVGPISEGSPLELRLAFDPRRVDAVEARMLLLELAALLTDPLDLVAHC
jgi:hypothetical protein